MRELIRGNKIGLCGIVVTHVAKNRMSIMFNGLFRRWEWVSNSDQSSRGCRIVVAWDPLQYDVRIIINTNQVLHCVVKQIASGITFYCSFVYVANDHVMRRQLWHSLEVFKQIIGDSPWVTLGDFNVMLHSSEVVGGVVGSSPANSDFRVCVSKIEVMDLHYDGIQYTWSGSPHGVGILKKIDRILVNLQFLSIFQGVKGNFLPRGTSDHSPAVVKFA